jgi:hypothetical protein
VVSNGVPVLVMDFEVDLIAVKLAGGSPYQLAAVIFM